MHLKIFSFDGAAQPVASNVTYLPFGPIQSYTLGNGQTLTRTYDANYRVTDIVSPALELHFVRDATGNITGVSEAGAGSESYRYDPLYRLAGVDDPSGQAIEAYTYNKTGDRLSKTGNGLATGVYGYQPGTHWLTSIGTASRTYDANGNTTGNAFAGEAWGYGYNGRNRMTVVQRNGVTVGTYVYNSLEQRTAKTANGTTTRFAYNEGSQLLSEATANASRDHLWLGGSPIGILDEGNATSLAYVHTDALGSPRAVSTGTGVTVWRWPHTNNPFGEAKPISTTGYALNLRFAGQYSDEESGKVYNMHRDYDALTGRYLQSDPIGLEAGASTYGYANGLSISAIDPLGLAAKVYVNDRNVTIVMPISYVGSPNPGWNDAISNKWSGVFGDLNVTTVVVGGLPGAIDTNLITIGPSGSRSYISWYKLGTRQDTGVWASDASGDVVSHEAGHILHLNDRYVDVPDPTNPWGVRSIPAPGYENNIMGNIKGRPSESDLLKIINNKVMCSGK